MNKYKNKHVLSKSNIYIKIHNFLDVLNYITSRHFNATTLNLHQICKKISINFKNMFVVVGWEFKLKIAAKYKIRRGSSNYFWGK